MKIKMFEIISTKEITYLKDLDNRIRINKYGKFNYYKLNELSNSKIWNFLSDLEGNKVYTLILFLSKNDRPDEPYIILSQQLLVTSNSNSYLIYDYINSKFDETTILYNISVLEDFLLIFKFKQVKIEFNEHKTF